MARSGPFISLGRIVGSHALKGDVLVNSYSRDINTFKLSPFLFIGLKERCKVAYRPLKIKKYSPTQMLISLHGINNRDRAEDLVGQEIFIFRGILPKLQDEEYYWHDLLGLSIITVNGQELGTLENIIETGANDVYLIRNGSEEVLIPAIQDVVKKIDLERGVMTVDIPPGLIQKNDF